MRQAAARARAHVAARRPRFDVDQGVFAKPETRRLGLDPRGFARMVVNLADVRAVFRARISRQLATAPDPELTALYEELLTPEPDDASSQRIDADVVIPMIIRAGG